MVIRRCETQLVRIAGRGAESKGAQGPGAVVDAGSFFIGTDAVSILVAVVYVVLDSSLGVCCELVELVKSTRGQKPQFKLGPGMGDGTPELGEDALCFAIVEEAWEEVFL